MPEILFFAIVQVCAGAAWFWMTVCRVMWMDRSTRARVRVGVSMSGAAALSLMLAPLVPQPYAQLFNALAGLGVCVAQWSKSYIWRGGVPAQFRRRRTDVEEVI